MVKTPNLWTVTKMKILLRILHGNIILSRQAQHYDCSTSKICKYQYLLGLYCTKLCNLFLCSRKMGEKYENRVHILQKSIFENIFDVNSALWCMLWNGSIQHLNELCVIPSSAEQMLLPTQTNFCSVLLLSTDGHSGSPRWSRRAYWLLPLNWWPFCFYMVSKSTGPTWQPWMFPGWPGLLCDIQSSPQRSLLGSRLCILQGPTVSGSPQAGGDNN